MCIHSFILLQAQILGKVALYTRKTSGLGLEFKG